MRNLNRWQLIEAATCDVPTEQRPASALSDEEKDFLSTTLRKLLLSLERAESEPEEGTAD